MMPTLNQFLFLKGRTMDHAVLLGETSVSWYVLRYDGVHRQYPFIMAVKRHLHAKTRQRILGFLVVVMVFGIIVFFFGWNELPPSSNLQEFLPAFLELGVVSVISSVFIGLLLLGLLGKSFFVAHSSPTRLHQHLREAFLRQGDSYPEFYHVITIDRELRHFRARPYLVVPEHWVMGYRVPKDIKKLRTRWTIGSSHRKILGYGLRLVLQGYFEMTIVPDSSIADRDSLQSVLQQVIAFFDGDPASVHDFHGMHIVGARMNEEAVTEISSEVLARLLSSKPRYDPTIKLPLGALVQS